MRKYVFMAMLVSLCACNNGGGHGGGGAKYNIGSSAGISGGTTTKPGEQPGGDNVPENPDDNTPAAPEYTAKRLEFESPVDAYPANYIGSINKDTGELMITGAVPEGAYYTISCKNESGCKYSVKFGEYAWDDTNSMAIKCEEQTGCAFSAKYTEYYPAMCTEKGGCTFIASSSIIPVNLFTNGVLNIEHPVGESGATIAWSDIMELGAEAQKVPLHFSDFGHWYSIAEEKIYDVAVFAGGDPYKLVDMEYLASVDKIKNTQTYTGKAYVTITPGYEVITAGGQKVVFEAISEKVGTAFVANGEAKLTFNPHGEKPTEQLNMNFHDAGWYNVFVKGDGTDLRFEGKPTLDDAYSIDTAPREADYVNIKYYGDTPDSVATESTGTISVNGVTMSDTLKRDIHFSFGAVKD